MNTKRFLNAALIIAIICGLSSVAISCSDDKNAEEEKQQPDEQLAETDLDLDRAAAFWNVVGQLTDDVMPDDWQHATYAPSIGEPDGENTAVRIVSTADIETAAARFAELTGANVSESTQDHTFQSDVVGTIKYHRTGGTSLATVDVDIPQMPGLSQIIYQSPEQMGGNGKFNGTAYYRFGDVVKKMNSDGQNYDYWICVRPAFGPAGKGDSHWVTVSKIPSANIKDVSKIITKIKDNKKVNEKVVHRLPKSLATNREHMQNFAEMLYAMTNPTKWASNLATNDGYKKLKYFRDFNYKELFKYNDDMFFDNVADKWEEWEQKGLFKEIFGMDRQQLKDILESIGLNLVYSSATMSGNKVVLPTATYYNTNLKTETLSKPNSEWTTPFDIQELTKKGYIEYKDIAGHEIKGWLVRYATGATLCKGSGEKVVNDKYKRLTNCEDVFVYNRNVLNLIMTENNLKNTTPYVFGEVVNPGYYTCGDIVRYKNRYYVCTSKHGKDGTARFITLNDQETHTTKTFKWEHDFMVTNDTVYNDDMASAETAAQWMGNILFNKSMSEQVLKAMKDKNLTKYIYQIIPETKDARDELIEFSTNNDFFLTNIYMSGQIGVKDYHLLFFVWNYIYDREEKVKDYDVGLMAPRAYTLVDHLVYLTSYDYPTEHWVPYIIALEEREFSMLIPYLSDEANNKIEKQIAPGYFEWQDMGIYEAEFDYTNLNETQHIKKTYHIVKLAQYWYHQWLTINSVNRGYVLNYTKDWRNHPDPETREPFESIPGSWISRCITSRELTFQDTGLKNSNCESVWVANEQ